MRGVVLAGGLLLYLTGAAVMAQDPVKVDPKHHKVEFENEYVRMVRVTIGPHEKTLQHEHPASATVYLTDLHTKIFRPDGTSFENKKKAGQTSFAKATVHKSENLLDTTTEFIQIELKIKP